MDRMDDTMNLIWQIHASQQISLSSTRPGSCFGMFRGASMTTSLFYAAGRSVFGATSASCSGMRRSSWAWGNPQRNLTVAERNWWARLLEEPSFHRVLDSLDMHT